jgi:hypothetical protein
VSATKTVCLPPRHPPVPAPASPVPDIERDDVRLCRFRSTDTCSSTSADEAFLFRKDREPLIGSSSRMRVSKIECELGSCESICAGNNSFAMWFKPDLRRGVFSSTGSGSSLFCTQLGHLHFSASVITVSKMSSGSKRTARTIIAFKCILLPSTLPMRYWGWSELRSPKWSGLSFLGPASNLQ